jgi:hypothetical protein
VTTSEEKSWNSWVFRDNDLLDAILRAVLIFSFSVVTVLHSSVTVKRHRLPGPGRIWHVMMMNNQDTPKKKHPNSNGNDMYLSGVMGKMVILYHTGNLL